LARSNELNWQNLVTIVSVMILIGTEVFGVALAGGWALAGLLELGEQVAYALMAIFSLMWILWRSSVAVEPIRGR
jgi:hypothetical protein